MSFPGEGVASSIVGGALNFYGAERANSANKRLAREQMKFQKESNQEQMAFQERMSNTSYQRSMEDMKKAGLNPILAFNQGGASSPLGSSSSGASATMNNPMSGAVSSALEARRASAELENMKEQKSVLETQRDLNKQLSDQSKTQSVLNMASAGEKVQNTENLKSAVTQNWVRIFGDIGSNALKLFLNYAKIKGF